MIARGERASNRRLRSRNETTHSPHSPARTIHANAAGSRAQLDVSGGRSRAGTTTARAPDDARSSPAGSRPPRRTRARRDGSGPSGSAQRGCQRIAEPATRRAGASTRLTSTWTACPRRTSRRQRAESARHHARAARTLEGEVGCRARSRSSHRRADARCAAAAARGRRSRELAADRRLEPSSNASVSTSPARRAPSPRTTPR